MEEFKKLREEFIKLSRDSFEKQAFEYFDFIAWLTSKIEKKSFSAVVIEKYSK